MLEGMAFRKKGRPQRAGVVQRLLRTRLVWRLSGLTYWSASKATKGKVMTRRKLLAHCEEEMKDLLFPILRKEDVVVEFGCGLGGNMIAISDRVREVIGVDINPLFLRHARRLARGHRNCRFEVFDGKTLPFADSSVDVVYSWAVFERIPKRAVEAYVREFHRVLRPRGRSVFYMLRPEAMETGFTRLLGDDAYVYFEREEVEALLKSCRFTIGEFVDWPAAHVCFAEKSVV